MGLYEELCAADVLGPIEGEIDSGRMQIHEIDGQAKILLRKNYLPHGPWVNALISTDRLCPKWVGIYFKFYRFIPKGCRHCWKIVWTGDTFEQLMKINEIQQEMMLESKCGIERRANTGKLGKYQGFWYAPLNKGLDGARKLRKELLERLMREPVLGGPNLILKRGCTEMEQQWPPSDKWDEYAEKFGWDRDEALCNAVFVDDHEYKPIPLLMKVNVMKGWMEYAAAHGDETVNKFADKPLIVPLMKYERSIHSGKDYPGYEVGEDRREEMDSEKREDLDGGRSSTGGTKPTLVTEF